MFVGQEVHVHVEEARGARGPARTRGPADLVGSAPASVHALQPAADAPAPSRGSACRSASACRLSQDFLPLASAISTLARPSLKYSDSGHDREALLVDPALDLVDLGAVEQQLALAAGGVVGPGALGVLRDVHAVQPGLVALDVDEPVDERGAPLPQRLHLGARRGPGRPRRCPRCGSRAAPSCSARSSLRPCSFGIRPFSQARQRITDWLRTGSTPRLAHAQS